MHDRQENKQRESQDQNFHDDDDNAEFYNIQIQEDRGKMIRIKTDTNQKMLQNFQHEAYPDISITSQNSKFNLVLAFLSIDSGYFSSLEPDIVEVDFSFLPEQALLQVLRALYGDQLIVCSVGQLEDIYQVISELDIQEYKDSIEKEILNSDELMQNLQILEFCYSNGLLIEELKKYHFENNLRALEDNKNFLQLNKISLKTMIPLLMEYHAKFEEAGYSVINNIMENYFNRNNIRSSDFFDEYEVTPLQNVWEQFHHTLQVYDRKPIKTKSTDFIRTDYGGNAFAPKKSFLVQQQSKKQESELLEEKNNRIRELESEIESREKLIEVLQNELREIKRTSSSSSNGMKRIPTIPMLPEDQEISIVEGVKNEKKDKIVKSRSKRSSEDAEMNEQMGDKSPSSLRGGYKYSGFHSRKLNNP